MSKVPMSPCPHVPSLKYNLWVFILSFGFLFLAGDWKLVTGNCYAKDINFELSVERKIISLGQSNQLYITFNDTQNIPAADLPKVDGLEFRYLGPSTRMSVVNGQVSSSVTHVYTFTALKTGIFKVGPLKFEYKGDTYNSNQITVEAVGGQAPSQGAAQEESTGIEEKDINERVFLVMGAKKSKAYLNEVIPLTIKLYVHRLGIRDIQYPEFTHEGFSLSEFGQPNQYQEAYKGANYEVIEFNTSVFGLRPQEAILGPAHLKCNLIVKKQNRRSRQSSFDDFFGADIFEDFLGRYETYPLDLKSSELPLAIFDLPQENKPQDFAGAIGVFDLDVNASPLEVKAGDPVTLKMTVTGQGNFSTVNAPKLKSEAGFKIYEPQVKEEKNAKSFEQVIMPMNEGINEIPEITFSYFDTENGAYRKITKGPFSIKVTKPQQEEAPKIVESAQTLPSVPQEKLGRDIIYIKASLGKLTAKGRYLYNNPFFLWIQLLPFLAFLFISFYRQRVEKLKTDHRYARLLAAPKKAKAGIKKAKECLVKTNSQEFYNALFCTLQQYLGDKFHLSSASITRNVVDDILKQRNINEDILAKLREIFNDCDMARYASGVTQKEDMEVILRKLEEVIDYLERHK